MSNFAIVKIIDSHIENECKSNVENVRMNFLIDLQLEITLVTEFMRRINKNPKRSPFHL
jgi:hypothetical protein